ncbi:MAG TPA: redoxin domain-containing protein [Verrucomicrobiae bacterium]|jgi:thiol-disulfide isomerase/thioredoxin|nr:redoxin domain-containing protein [Verrucomicrobiae bacterium]
MMRPRTTIIAILCCGLIWGCVTRPRGILAERPADSLLRGAVLARVFIFVSDDCPISNKYAPEIRRLHERYAPQGVAFWMVHSDPSETRAEVADHDAQYHLDLPVYMDPDHAVARLAGAELVPTATVFSADGQLLYRGRIDDRFAQIGSERPEPTVRDLQNALEAVVNHRPVPVRFTRAVGCYIPSAR